MSHSVAQSSQLSTDQVMMLRNLLANYCGVYLDDSRHETIQSLVRQRAGIVGQPLSSYAYNLFNSQDNQELQHIAELLLNHETVFFRHRQHMAALRNVILPDMHRRLPPGLPIRIWSAGCATGEEAYSIAMTALEALGDPLPRPVEVLGSDLSETALRRARTGIYRGRTLGNLTEAQRRRFFTPRSNESLAIGEQLRRMVHFERRNLLEPLPSTFRGIHMIFCQNVTIYFQIDTCRDLMGRFYEILAEHGTLFLGFSETLWNIFDRFRWREVGGTYVYYKESQRTAEQTHTSIPGQQAAPSQRISQTSVSIASTTDRMIAQGQALINAGNSEAALETFSTAPLRDARTPQILALAAHAHANRGDLDLAAAEAQRALALDPLTTEAHLLMGMIYARQGQPAEAIQQLERARYLNPAAPLISFHLAESYRQVGRTEAARREYRNTIQKLVGQPPEQLIDGVAVGWLAQTCQRYLTILQSG